MRLLVISLTIILLALVIVMPQWTFSLNAKQDMAEDSENAAEKLEPSAPVKKKRAPRAAMMRIGSVFGSFGGSRNSNPYRTSGYQYRSRRYRRFCGYRYRCRKDRGYIRTTTAVPEGF